MSRSRGWTFTYNRYTPEGEARVRGVECQYMCYGHEVAPTTGTPHLQGYLYFSNPRMLTGVKKLFPDGIHFEAAKGTAAQNKIYCSKTADPNFFEKGESPISPEACGEMEQDRWKRIRTLCKEGNFADLPDDFVCQHPGNFERIMQLHMLYRELPSRPVLDNYWVTGETGIGKSRSIRDWAEGHGLKVFDKDATKWWTGYRDEEVVHIEEFEPSDAKQLAGMLKKWTDHYPVTVETKNGYIKVRPLWVFISSNYDIDMVFPMDRELVPLNRRFKKLHLKGADVLAQFPPLGLPQVLELLPDGNVGDLNLSDEGDSRSEVRCLVEE